MRGRGRDARSDDRIRRLASAIAVVVALGWQGPAMAASIASGSGSKADSHAKACHCGKACRPGSCCCGPRQKGKPVSRAGIDSGPCVGEAPCGDPASPSKAPRLTLGRAAILGERLGLDAERGREWLAGSPSTLESLRDPFRLERPPRVA